VGVGGSGWVWVAVTPCTLAHFGETAAFISVVGGGGRFV